MEQDKLKMEIEKEKKKVEVWIKKRAMEYADRTVKGGGKYRKSTMGTSGYGWDPKLHHYMPAICSELNKLGITVKHSVNFNVTDWDMFITI